MSPSNEEDIHWFITFGERRGNSDTRIIEAAIVNQITWNKGVLSGVAYEADICCAVVLFVIARYMGQEYSIKCLLLQLLYVQPMMVMACLGEPHKLFFRYGNGTHKFLPYI